MRKTSKVEKICTVCEKIGDIGDSVKGSSSRMKNKVGAQKGAFIKMKQENIYNYQWLYGLRYVPIIGTISNSSQVYLSRLNPRILRFIARFLSSIINLN